MKIVFLGTAEDSEPWMDSVGVNLCGKTDLWETSGILANAKAVLAPDNGLSALSAAMGVPTVVLWGPTCEDKNRKFGPRVWNIFSPTPCAPCQRSEMMEACRAANCMSAINPLRVVEAARIAVETPR